MLKRRTKFRTLSNIAIKERNKQMFLKFKKLRATGRYGTMHLYQILGDEFDIEERNSVGGIIRKMLKEETQKQNLICVKKCSVLALQI